MSALSLLMNRHYESIWCWVVRIGALRWGEDQVRKSVEFHRCYALHAEMVPELKRAGNRADLGRIAASIDSINNAIGTPMSPAKEGCALEAELERTARQAAEDALYTSDGLDWRPTIYTAGGGDRRGRMYVITPIQALPQPLHLRIRCSELVDVVDLRLLEDAAGKGVTSGDQPPVVIEPQGGNYIHITVRYPKIRPPRSMNLTLVREAGDFAVESIEYAAADAEPA